MYYRNVALSEHCEDVPLEHQGMWLNTTGTPRNVPLEHHGSVHWNTEEVCEVAPFTQCHCWDEEAAQFRQERELQLRQQQSDTMQSCYMVPPYHSSILDHTTFRVTSVSYTHLTLPTKA